MPRTHCRRGPRRTAWATGIAALGLLALGAGITQGGWASAQLQNPANSVRTGAVAITHAYTGGPCTLTTRTSSLACAGGLGTTASPAAGTTDGITNNGSLALAQTVTAASCGPVQFANAISTSDPMLPRNAVAFRQQDKWGTPSAATFTGTGYATDVVGTGGGGLLGLLQKSYSIGVWFNAADALGGGLISLDGSLSNAATATGDPMVWLDSAGHVNFSTVGTLGAVKGATTATYGSGWHFVVLTANTTGLLTLTKTVTLYVDGVAVASNSGLTLLTSTSGYWHLGWADFTGATAPGSAYFHGSLSGAFVNPSAVLSAANVSALYAAGSATAYRNALTALSGTASIWMLDDTGTTTTTATLPTNLTGPCGRVNGTLSFSSPNVTIGPLSLAALANGSARAAGTLPAGAVQGLTLGTTPGTGYNADLAGIHLYVPLTFGYGVAPWSASMTWTGPEQVFRG